MLDPKKTPYRISKISIENFKAFENIVFEVSSDFNIIIGKNGIGKTTIFEALILWNQAFMLFISPRNKKKFYDNFCNSSSYGHLNFHEMFMIRNTTSNDLFSDINKKKIKIGIEVSDLKDLNKKFNLKIVVEKPATINDAYFRVSMDKDNLEEFKKFEKYSIENKINLDRTFFIYQTKPVSIIHGKEPFFNNAQILKKIYLGRSSEVLRNKLLKTKSDAIEFEYIESRLKSIFNKNYKIKSKNKNSRDEEYVKINVREDEKRDLELSLYGSGFLQIIEIFSTLKFIDESNIGLNILLIDEPDSHIHADIQSNLIDNIRKTEDVQIFIISHNERFIKKAQVN